MTSIIVVRADSAYYAGASIVACRRNGARFSGTVRMGPRSSALRRHRRGRLDADPLPECDLRRSVRHVDLRHRDRRGALHRVRVQQGAPHRRVADRAPRQAAQPDRGRAQGQGGTVRHLPPPRVFTDSPFALVQAESQHRGHAVVEQVLADLIDGPLAHLPSSQFNTNAAWLQLAVTAHALTRTLGTLASAHHAQGPRRHHPQRAHHRRRAPRPQRTRPGHLAPARSMALATRLERRLPRHPPRPPTPAAWTYPRAPTFADPTHRPRGPPQAGQAGK